MQKVTAFKTTDGQIHEDEQLAFKHQNKIDFQRWYEEERLYGNYAGSRVEFDELVNWLQTNKAEVRKFLDSIGE